MDMTMGINAAIKEKILQNRDIILAAKAADEPDILVCDGIVDETCYSARKTKILVLLRDGNDPKLYEDGNGCTYRDLYEAAIADTKDKTQKKRLYAMWRCMCMWSRIIEDDNFTLEQCWDEKRGFDADNMRKYLLHIATVNIKKSAGKGTNDKSYSSSLNRAVKEYYSLIKEEITLIKPDIVLCGGTFDYIVGQYNAEIHTLLNGKRYFADDEVVYLECCHPSARFGYRKHFTVFKETYSALLEQLK